MGGLGVGLGGAEAALAIAFQLALLSWPCAGPLKGRPLSPPKCQVPDNLPRRAGVNPKPARSRREPQKAITGE